MTHVQAKMEWAQRDRYETHEAYYGGDIAWKDTIEGVCEKRSAKGWHLVSMAPLRSNGMVSHTVMYDTYLLVFRLPMGVPKER